MTRKVIGYLLLSFFFITLLGCASAEDVYVKNKLFKGRVVGTGLSTEVSLDDLATALGMKVTETNGRWNLGDVVVPGRSDEGKILVPVSALKKAGYRIIHSSDLGTLDISPPRSKTAATNKQSTAYKPMSEIDNRLPTLVYFGAPW